MNQEKVYLMIIDGFGEGKDYEGNAVKKAKMPNLDKLKLEYPNTLLHAAGNEVGLPDDVMGNSEVGHYTIGSGRITFQSLEEINQSIKDKSFFSKRPLVEAFDHTKKNNSALHLLGMISDEGVHAHTNHLFALLEMVKNSNIPRTYIHCITDGRDVEERSATRYLQMITDKIAELGLEDKVHIATIVGRYYAMDRDKNWDRTERAYNLYTAGEGEEESDPFQAIENAYKEGAETDYYIEPIILNKNGIFKEEDSVIFFNFRTDRPRQLTAAFTGEGEIGFTPASDVRPLLTVFGAYSEKAHVVFPPEQIENNLATVLENAGATQLHIAETEKYAHVTYFFNSQVEDPSPHEERIMIDSPKVPSYDEKPEMSAKEVTNKAIEELDKGYNFIVQNFANPDLVGHSGKMDATVKACEVIDECIGRISAACLQKGYHLIITADHGNAEFMIYEDNKEPCPSHTQNPVPCILVSSSYKDAKLKDDQGLKDLAPTILDILDIAQPQEMTGQSLISNQ
ncbi:2,3-bisphosphoglycerate-independent phosphoglycerate mutase [Pseudomonadota bacterium]